MLVTAILGRWSILPTIACDGAQALRLATGHDFDSVLMDVMLPVMDGIAATAVIRKFEWQYPGRPAVPILAYTTFDLAAQHYSVQRAGFTAVLAKPCDAHSLRANLARWCPDKFVVELKLESRLWSPMSILERRAN